MKPPVKMPLPVLKGYAELAGVKLEMAFPEKRKVPEGLTEEEAEAAQRVLDALDDAEMRECIRQQIMAQVEKMGVPITNVQVRRSVDPNKFAVQVTTSAPADPLYLSVEDKKP